ncbi:hypothetical protein EYC98_12785 [Halieaceae bacterium IMCC14734]|uniref:ABC transporter permease n=1 Tax=Candidatus Litorirhabdus singularis TaxID=2518993 RepID=A0ABT3THP8_9GAMM|nr:hypothetical protein [Candidatus Litorirhabdus singularis]MCX2981735.1 hypothetical protein [Candidatus Litorirhabdus singularis]
MLLITPAILVLAQVLIVLLGMFAAEQILTTNLDKVGAWVSSSGNNVSISVTVDQPIEVGNSAAVGKQPLPGATGPVGGQLGGAPDAGSLLTVLLPLVHLLFVWVLILISTIYLLGTLYNDRRDRSILFFKSMPVAEWQELGSKLLVAVLLAPAIYLFASCLSQGMLWLLLGTGDQPMDSGSVVGSVTVAGAEPFSLLQLWSQQGLALLTGLLWVVPFYMWLLLASAAASRSPVLIAILVPIALIVVERVVLGSSYSSALGQLYLPQFSPVSDDSGGVQPSPGLQWLVAGWVAAAVMFAVTAWLRKFRFEL